MSTILILGATRGMGRSLARHYAEQGHRLILMGRNAEELEASAADARARPRRRATHRLLLGCSPALLARLLGVAKCHQVPNLRIRLVDQQRQRCLVLVDRLLGSRGVDGDLGRRVLLARPDRAHVPDTIVARVRAAALVSAFHESRAARQFAARRILVDVFPHLGALGDVLAEVADLPAAAPRRRLHKVLAARQPVARRVIEHVSTSGGARGEVLAVVARVSAAACLGDDIEALATWQTLAFGVVPDVFARSGALVVAFLFGGPLPKVHGGTHQLVRGARVSEQGALAHGRKLGLQRATLLHDIDGRQQRADSNQAGGSRECLPAPKSCSCHALLGLLEERITIRGLERVGHKGARCADARAARTQRFEAKNVSSPELKTRSATWRNAERQIRD